MFKSISMYCDQCEKDISIQENEILELNVCDEGFTLQEILNKHLQQKVDDHFTALCWDHLKQSSLPALV